MTTNTAYLILLIISIGLMLAQLSVKQKNLVHILYAIFCGSMAMVAAQHLSAESLGPYQYIIGAGTCATCNAMWLISKALFSDAKSISARHIGFALLISLLIILNQTLQMALEFSVLSTHVHEMLKSALTEMIILFSSTVLALTFWEAIKGIRSKSKAQRRQRYLFISSFSLGVFLCTIVAKAFFEPDKLAQIYPWFVAFSAIQIMLVTQVILFWQKFTPSNVNSHFILPKIAPENEPADIDPKLIVGINTLLVHDKKYLTHHLKMIDIANDLGVSEYKISQTIRYHFSAPNFNHFINSFRIKHAQELFSQTSTNHWTVLVIALESGFSSVTSFNRAFKAKVGCAPAEYRRTLKVRDIQK